MKKAEKLIIQSAVLLIALISEKSFCAECMPWTCSKPGSFANVGNLTNPGPHTVCVGDSPPQPNITGTSVTLGTIARICTTEITDPPISSPSSPERRTLIYRTETKKDTVVSTKTIINPPLPNTYKKYGSYTYTVSQTAKFQVC